MKNLLMLSLLLFVSSSLFSQLSREVGFWSQSYYEKGIKVSKQKAGEILKEVDLSNHLWQTAKRNEMISYISAGAAIGGYLYTSLNDESKDDLGILIVSLGASVASIVTTLNANKKYNLAIRTYNEALGKGKVGFQTKLYLSPSKVGLIANF